LALSRAARGRYLALSAGCLLAGFVFLVIAVWSGPGQWLDARANSTVLQGTPALVGAALTGLARGVAVPVLAAVAAAVMLLGALRGERARVLLAVLVPAVTVPLALWLRDSAISRPALGVPGYAHNTFPSVHATAAFALMAVIALLWPGPSRPWHIVVLLLSGMAVGLGNVTGHDHRPADVVGSMLLVLGVTFLWAAAAPGRRTAARPLLRQGPRDETRASAASVSR
jgi:membrane-associated phospholipid phosphatase